MASDFLGSVGRTLGGLSSRLEGVREQVKAAAEPVVDAAVGRAMELGARAGVVSDCGMVSTFTQLAGDTRRFTVDSNRAQSAHRLLMEMMERLGRI